MSGSLPPFSLGVSQPDTANDQTRYLQMMFDHIMKQSNQANPDPGGGQNYMPMIQALIAGNGGGQLGQTVMDQLSGKTQAPLQHPYSYDPQQVPLGAFPPPLPPGSDIGQPAQGPDYNIPTDVWSRGLLQQLLGMGPGGRT